MNAVISGRAGAAILVDGDHLSSLDASEPEARVPRRADEAWRLLGDAQDLRFVEDVTIEAVREQLELETSADEALHLALILLDAEREDDLRREAAEALETLLASEAVAVRLEGVLYARPLPAETDPAGAIRVGRQSAAGAVVRLLEGLSACQLSIADVWGAWDAIPMSVFGSGEDRKRALVEMVREGIFRDMAHVRASGGRLDALVAAALERAAVRKVQNHEEIMARWSRMIAETGPGAFAPVLRAPLDVPATPAYFERATWLGQLEKRGLVHVDWAGLAKVERGLEQPSVGREQPVPHRYPRRTSIHALFRPRAAA